MNAIDTTKKITRATFKSFVNKNRENLQILTKRRFDGMVDGCVSTGQVGFEAVVSTEHHLEHTYGIQGAWLVLGGGDRFHAFEKDGVVGIEVYNCCGSFIVGIQA